MDKETEIKHLRALQQGDTYFAQYFRQDVDQMVQNIQNDFAIEYGCSFAEKASTFKRLLDEVIQKLEDTKFNTAVVLYSELGDSMSESIRRMILNSLGSPLRVIEAKSAANVPPTKDEVEYLIKMAKQAQQ